MPWRVLRKPACIHVLVSCPSVSSNCTTFAGSANVPSYFASRNAAVCFEQQCQVCTFIREMEEYVVMQCVTINDITSGRATLPSSRSAWLTIQAECQYLRRTHAQLKQGTRPSKKITNAKDVKRYLNVASIARDGMLVVRRNDPLSPSRECIIVPRMVLNGLVTAHHIQLEHPSAHQLKHVMRRYLFALDLDRAIDDITQLPPLCLADQHSNNDSPAIY